MIYASDLDRTLLYSDRFLESHPCDSELNLADESSVNSYISKQVLDKLTEVSRFDGVRFIPITTRNLAQYQRINLGDINPEYAITSNGGVVVYKGERMIEWDAYINSELNRDELEEIRGRFDELPGACRVASIVDGVFVFTKSDDINAVREVLPEFRCKYPNYRFIIEKQKVYALPEIVRKENALNWLKNILGEKFVIASGDSEFDMGILSEADIPVVPGHHTIKSESMDKLNNPIIVDGFALSPLKTLDIVTANQYQ